MSLFKCQDISLQYGRGGKEASSSKVLRVLEHEEKIQVSNKDSYKFHDATENKTNKQIHYMNSEHIQEKGQVCLYWEHVHTLPEGSC